jgi:tRNA A-37 threonylcarbamoyl transferase component Bud32/tetratricopeptide (TPR) repeat protein
MREPSDAQPTETVAPDAVSPWPGPSRLSAGALVGGRYEIRDVLGSGGTAVVYRAFDRLIKRQIALKVLRPERLTANALVRLRREANTARDVAHPNLIRVFDLEAADGLMFLAMELVEGETLRECLKRGALPIDEAVRIARCLLEGLSALHVAGLLHRDVKPGNVLLAATGEVKLADLGLVRRWESDETRATESEAVIGTFEYLSPEQALGEELDVRSDLYSAGVLLFEMFAGRLPHEGKSSLGTLLASLRKPIVPLRSLRKDIPAWLADLVEKLLERRRDDRYPSATAALADFESRSVGGGRRRTRVRRLYLGATLLAVLTAFGAVAVWQRRTELPGIVVNGTTSVRAVDRAGRTLWRKEGVRPSPNFLPLRLDRGRRVAIAAALDGDEYSLSPKRQVVHLLAPRSGESIARLSLPTAGQLFPEMADSFAREIHVFDVDGDGSDELFVVFTHMPYWPSFTVLCEPTIGRCRLAFVAAGHHRPIGAVDLDADGRAELLFAGYANRMGALTGLAAVRISPWLGEAPIGEVRLPAAASTPDEARPRGESALLWYLLLPPPRDLANVRLEIDAERRQIGFDVWNGQPQSVTFDGFRVAEASTLDAAQREGERRAAYEALQQTRRFASSGRPAEALASAETAVAAAQRANDSLLVEWSSRRLVAARIEAAQFDAAEALVASRLERSVDPSQFCWEAAHAFHLRGELARAVRWYEHGLERIPDAYEGRFTEDELAGLVFAHAELGDWGGAHAAVRKWGQSLEILRLSAQVLGLWIDWRSGQPVVGRMPDVEPGSPDLFRYLALEVELLHGGEPESIRQRARAERARSTATIPLLLGLEAEILGRAGRLEEARALARQALERARAESAIGFLARAHLGLIEERSRRLGAL